LGWLGWSEEQALSADVNAILVGYRGKVDMLTAIFGSADDEPAEHLPVFTPDAMRGLSKRRGA
jgi:hypothetical protein